MINKLAFLEIVVKDFDQAFEWYTQVLGLEIDGQMIENEDGLWCQLKTLTGDNRLALWKPGWAPDQKKDLYSLVPVFEVIGLDALVRDLETKKVTFLESVREMPSYRITTIADPEGNRLQLFEPKEVYHDPVH